MICGDKRGMPGNLKRPTKGILVFLINKNMKWPTYATKRANFGRPLKNMILFLKSFPSSFNFPLKHLYIL